MKPRLSVESVENGISQQNLKKASCSNVLTLAYQSLGVVYGDLSTSPLYVYKTTFSGKLSLHEDDEEIYGVLSFIFWTLSLIALFKYIFIVISANDNGEGGTFALYSLLCRHARLSILPNQQDRDEQLSSYAIEGSTDTWQSSILKTFFEKHPKFCKGLLIFVLLGTCMAIGDGILTPAISVLSAVSGVKLKFTGLHENYIVMISCVIFGVEGWVSLGGVFLSITGVEAMFADLGHFSALSIKIAFTFLVYPCLVLAYLGEAAFLSRHHEDIQRKPIFWPVFIVATFAAVIGSQAVISGYLFAYKPVLRIKLLSLCENCSHFKAGSHYRDVRDNLLNGNGDDNCVEAKYCHNLCLSSVFWISGTSLYLSAALYKVPEGGWIPLVLSLLFMAIMFLWNYGTLKKHKFDVENKVSMNRILSLGPSLGMVRVPGIGLVYTNLVTGVPAVFGHFVTNLPAFHQVVIFICVKSVQVPYVNEKERFLIGRVGPKEYGMFRCVVRYGYRDLQQENYDFENKLVYAIIQFVENEGLVSSRGYGNLDGEAHDSTDLTLTHSNHEEKMVHSLQDFHAMESGNGHLGGSSLKDESLQILKERESGIAYILGHSHAQAKKSSSIFKKFAIDVVYAFLSKNCREPDVALSVPHTSLIEVDDRGNEQAVSMARHRTAGLQYINSEMATWSCFGDGHLLSCQRIRVSYIFSVSGDFNLTLLDHLIAEPGINNIGCCNDLNAGYAADGYARSWGVGVW
ncbi:potassium transporter 1 [Actinidia rufa]|uniref:Potassium transporter 1 n=1 Tax=Actinidia rufa TaxID=165716 RepID=A0A7J0FL42_9ERIC|nr:potassium transporter 1 [Actinidia rufa]